MLKYVRECNSNTPWHWHTECPDYPKERPYILVYHTPARGQIPLCPKCMELDKQKEGQKVLAVT